jgi:hypothetical protein
MRCESRSSPPPRSRERRERVIMDVDLAILYATVLKRNRPLPG